MTRSLALRFSRFIFVAAACVTALWSPAWAHEVDARTTDPGFRPTTEFAAAFLDAMDTATIAVYPTIVRRADRTAHSFASQTQIVASLSQDEMATVVAKPRRIDLGKLAGRSSQWDLFLNDMQRITETLQSHEPDADYHLFMEFVLPVSNQSIFGIHCYVLDQQGRNAFSFLLNSHHELFVDARLEARNTSEAARAELVERATRAGIAAFKAQVAGAKESRASASNADYAINELPMYGNARKTADQKRADEIYIKTMTKGGQSREAAAESAARVGWNLYYDGDHSTAIKRFNQAWLLDPENYLALWGFAVISIDRGQLDEAVHFFRMAIDNGAEDPALQQDYETALRMLEQQSV